MLAYLQNVSLDSRFWSKVNKTSTCWVWTACKNQWGYGVFSYQSRARLAHRLAWAEQNGPIPEGLELDHICRVRGCVNPAHLEAVTRQTNQLRGEGISAKNAVKTVCPKGHPLVGDNVHSPPSANGKRECNTCRKARKRSKNSQRDYAAEYARRKRRVGGS